tara:strand:- start:3918 stop:4544 length:627 start_codon:yes stop_codon:yes gene_type:complete
MEDIKEIISELRENGFCVLKDFWPSEKCRQAIDDLSRISKNNFEIGQGGDIRCQRSHLFSKAINDFFEDAYINEIASRYSNCSQANRVLAGVLQPVDGKIVDSGGGWHVDSAVSHQFKSMLYLTDVSSKNGPFLFIPKSKHIIDNIPKYDNMRIDENTIKEYFSEDDIEEIVGQAGTCILVDTTYTHRGKQIEEGKRISLTTYFYEKK